MANENDQQSASQKRPARGGSHKSSGGGAKKRAGKRPAAAAGARAQAATGRLDYRPRTDHTPPPILIESGSLTLETDGEFVGRDNTGGTGHPRRHKMRSGRSIKGLRVLSASGKTVYVDDHADGSLVEIWWDPEAREPQIRIGDGNLDLNADFDLGAGTIISRPPITNTVRRIRRFSHPRAGNRGIEKVRITKDTLTVEPDNVWMVLIWDTSHLRS